MIRTRMSLILVLALVATTFAAAGCNRSQPDQTTAQTHEAISNHGTVQISWEGDLESALERARTEEKTVLVNFYAEWCVWCKRLETTTLRDASVASMLSERVVPVSLNVEEEGLEISDDYGVSSLPTVVVLNGDGQEIGRITGYFPPTGFMERVESFLHQG